MNQEISAGMVAKSLYQYSSLDVHVRAGGKLYRVTGINPEPAKPSGVMVVLETEEWETADQAKRPVSTLPEKQ